MAVENDNKIQTQVEMYNIMIRYMYVYVMCYITQAQKLFGKK